MTTSDLDIVAKNRQLTEEVISLRAQLAASIADHERVRQHLLNGYNESTRQLHQAIKTRNGKIESLEKQIKDRSTFQIECFFCGWVAGKIETRESAVVQLRAHLDTCRSSTSDLVSRMEKVVSKMEQLSKE